MPAKVSLLITADFSSFPSKRNSCLAVIPNVLPLCNTIASVTVRNQNVFLLSETVFQGLIGLYIFLSTVRHPSVKFCLQYPLDARIVLSDRDPAKP